MISNDLAHDMLRYRGGIKNNDLLEILKNMENLDETLNCCSESPYIDMQAVDSYLVRFKDKFSVLDLNIQSLNSKFDSLLVFLNQLASRNFHFSAICLQETWINNKGILNSFNIHNYHVVHLPGGLVIYVHKSFQVKEINLYSASSLWEAIFLEINGGGLKRKLFLSNIYRPP